MIAKHVTKFAMSYLSMVDSDIYYILGRDDHNLRSAVWNHVAQVHIKR